MHDDHRRRRAVVQGSALSYRVKRLRFLVRNVYCGGERDRATAPLPPTAFLAMEFRFAATRSRSSAMNVMK